MGVAYFAASPTLKSVFEIGTDAEAPHIGAVVCDVEVVKHLWPQCIGVLLAGRGDGVYKELIFDQFRVCIAREIVPDSIVLCIPRIKQILHRVLSVQRQAGARAGQRQTWVDLGHQVTLLIASGCSPDVVRKSSGQSQVGFE